MMMQSELGLKRNKAGTALITVILIVAVVSITAITMQGYLRGEISRAQMLLDSDELYNNLLGAEALGISKISKFSKSGSNSRANFRLEYLNKETAITAEIIDQTGLFNINYLYNPNGCNDNTADNGLDINNAIITRIFKNLLINLNSDMQLSSADAKEITKNIQTWMCPENMVSSGDKTKSSNSNISTWEYQPSAQLFFDISELKLIAQINNTIYGNIKDKIAVLPSKLGFNRIFNINTMSAALLAAISGAELNTAQRYLDESSKKPDQEKLNDLIIFIENQKIYGTKELEKLKTMLDPNKNHAQYFLIRGEARKNDNIMGLTTLVEFSKEIRVIWRKRGLNENA